MTESKREQVAKQCEVVAYLATALVNVHTDYAKIMRDGHIDQIIEMIGSSTARLMEILGDILNGMDAVDETDEWTAPIFEEAHRLWPQKMED